MKQLYFLLFILLPFAKTKAQRTQNDNYLPWSSTRKLTANDFLIKTGRSHTTISYGQFSMDFEVHGFDFMTKNFNKKVSSFFIKSASSLDTTSDINVALRYQQTLFDLFEIYTRQFRKALKENRKKILTGTDFVKTLNEQAMADFAHRRLAYDTDTNFGSNTIMQRHWEAQIQKELALLKDFSNE